MKRELVVMGCCLLVACVGLAQPQITLGDNTVKATGITPGGQAVWFGVAREQGLYRIEVVTRREIVTDEDGDGVVRLDVPGGIVPMSVWAVVDLASGEIALAMPPGTESRLEPFPSDGFVAGTAAGPGHLQLRKELQEMCLVRPGVGAWHGRAGDGAAGDGDGQPDGVVTIRPAILSSFGSAAKGIGDYRRGDVVVLVEPRLMEFTWVRIGSGRS